MNTPSSTIQAAGVYAFIAATVMLVVKIAWPQIYVMIPPEYQGYLVGVIAFIGGYFQKENVLNVV